MARSLGPQFRLTARLWVSRGLARLAGTATAFPNPLGSQGSRPIKKPPPARLHLLPAKEAPYTIILRRKPTNWFHVMRWNTQTDHMEHGSWYAGTLYPKRADVSFDGDWLVFLAMDPGSNTFNRMARPPLLTPIVEVPADGTYRGGDYWESASQLHLNGWLTYAKGWRRVGDTDAAWCQQPTATHPSLHMREAGYKNGTLHFKFWLDAYPALIPDTADWACWDCLGQLLFTNKGSVYKFALDDLARGLPTTVVDLEHLAPPPA